MKIIFAGNCQAPLLASMFSAASRGVTVVSLEPTYTMRDEHKDRVLNEIESADYIFAQRTSSTYFLEWLRPAFLRAEFKTRCLIWPNIYFDGYFPGTGYLYKDKIGKVLSPLEDYHIIPLIDAYRRGFAAAAAASEFLDLNKVESGDPFEASFRELERREQDVDVIISDFLRASTQARRCMYTPNHPCNFILAELGARLARKAGIAFDVTAATKLNYRLDRIYVSTFPRIVDRLSLPFDVSPLFRGLEVTGVASDKIVLGNARAYLVQDLVEAYWRIYEQVPP